MTSTSGWILAGLKPGASSYGLTQIMGWHVINDLNCTIDDLRDLEKHLHFAVKLLGIVSGNNLQRKEYDDVLRIWNTGNENGKTYHESYVPNALSVMRAYQEISRTAALAARPDSALKSTKPKTPIFGALLRKSSEATGTLDTVFDKARDVSTNISDKAAVVEQVKTTVGTVTDIVGLPGTRPFDLPIKVTRGGLFSRVLAAICVFFGAMSSYLGALLSNWKLIALGVGAVFVIVVIVVVTTFALDWVRLNYRSKLDRYNVD